MSNKTRSNCEKEFGKNQKCIGKKAMCFLMVSSLCAMLLGGCSLPWNKEGTDNQKTSEKDQTNENDVFVNLMDQNGNVYETLRPELVKNGSVSDMAVTDYEQLGVSISFEGAWDEIESEEYQKQLKDVFYTVYPRLLARWGMGDEAKDITFWAENEDGVAWSTGDTIGVSVKHANTNPMDLGFFAHELTHSAQNCYPGFETEWFCEGLASYGRFRYFEWMNEDTIQYIDQHSQEIGDWYYAGYGNCLLFFAYMDYYYPTTQNEDGSLSYGLLDTLNRGIREGIVESDLTYADPNSTMNGIVQEITGYETMDELRLAYVEACETDSWVFTGFAEYQDNFLTENIPGLSDGTYPTLHVGHGQHTAEVEDATFAVYADNIFADAIVLRTSGYISEEENVSMLIDGNTETKWCATEMDVRDVAYQIEGVEHYVVMDLSEEKSFDSYTIANAGTLEEAEYNASSWELLVSEDGKNFYSLDYQKDCYENEATFMVPETSCRYVMLKVYVSDDGPGTIRLYELGAGMK